MAAQMGLSVGGDIACGYCAAMFPTDRNRRKHINRVHESELPIRCPFCPRRFEQARAVQTHCGQRHPDRYVHRRKHHGVQRDWNLRTKYGISLSDYERLLAAQSGRCATCGSLHADCRGRRLHVDHDHATGRVRGLLCANCNMALGKVRDDPGLLRRLAEYVETR